MNSKIKKEKKGANHKMNTLTIINSNWFYGLVFCVAGTLYSIAVFCLIKGMEPTTK